MVHWCIRTLVAPGTWLLALAPVAFVSGVPGESGEVWWLSVIGSPGCLSEGIYHQLVCVTGEQPRPPIGRLLCGALCSATYTYLSISPLVGEQQTGSSRGKESNQPCTKQTTSKQAGGKRKTGPSNNHDDRHVGGDVGYGDDDQQKVWGLGRAIS